MYNVYNTVTKPFRGHGLGDKWPINTIVQHVESFIVSRQDSIVDINGYKLRVHGLSGGICKQLLSKQPYEPLTTEIIRSIPNMSNVIDVGANVGYYTILLSQLVKGRVWAFEPEKHNLDVLFDNVELNHCDNVIIMPFAVSDKASDGKLFVSNLESGEHSLVVKRHFHFAQQVTIMPLDDLCSARIDLIKTDTEGNDFKVLLGARKLISSNPKLVLITEFWPDGISKSGYSPKTFWSFLYDAFKQIYVIDELGNQVVTGIFEDAVNRASKGLSVNLLCTNEEML